MVGEYKMRLSDFIPVRGIDNYISRNGNPNLDSLNIEERTEVFHKQQRRERVLQVYNAAILISTALVLTGGIEKTLN